MENKALTEQEEVYNNIISFYDFAEELVNSVEDQATKDPIAQLELVEPLVSRIEDATDTLSEEYRSYVTSGKTPGFLGRRKNAKSLKMIYYVLGECINPGKAMATVASISAKIADKAKKQMEKILSVTNAFRKNGMLGPNTYRDVENYSKTVLDHKVNRNIDGQSRNR